MEIILKNIKENGITNIEVFQDNAGGLTLAVWRKCEFFCLSGFEYCEGFLVAMLEDLQENFPGEFDYVKEITEDEYMNMSSDINHGCVVLNIEGFCNIDAMGFAGRREFAEFIAEDK